MMKQTAPTRTQRSDAGLVSIMVTMVMMLVITLIVIGFSQISRREQSQSRDRQHSTQAFLAAESGVNDARVAIQAGLAAGTLQDKTECGINAGTPQVYRDNLQPVIDSANDVSYSCLLVSTQLPDLLQDVPLDSGGVVVPITPVSGTIRTIHLKWTAPGVTTTAGCPGGIGSLPASTGWACRYGMLRVDMVGTSPLNRAALSSSQKAFFLYPTTGAAPAVDYNSPITKGAVRAMRCTVTDCRVDILVSGSTANNLMMRFNSVYLAGTVQLTVDNPAGNPVLLKGAQAQVDVTGKAQDVLRRIQVRLSLLNKSDSPGYALISGSAICKRFSVSDTLFIKANDIQGQDSQNPMCVP
jgi:Tfp pilus assembly protein PilX